MLAQIRVLAADRALSVEHLVLTWTLHNLVLSHVFVDVRNAEQAKHNAQAGSIELSDEEMQVVNQAAANWKDFVFVALATVSTVMQDYYSIANFLSMHD